MFACAKRTPEGVSHQYTHGRIQVLNLLQVPWRLTFKFTRNKPWQYKIKGCDCHASGGQVQAIDLQEVERLVKHLEASILSQVKLFEFVFQILDRLH